MQVTEPFVIDESVKTEIDHWVAKYPIEQKRSAVVPALLLVQTQNGGWLSQQAMLAVADYLGLAAIEVFEVATFYDMYELKPIGHYKIGLCTNVSCMLRGSDDILAAIKQRLGIEPGQTTTDGRFTLREWECLGACANAPVCQINNETFYEDLTAQKMLDIIDELQNN